MQNHRDYHGRGGFDAGGNIPEMVTKTADDGFTNFSFSRSGNQNIERGGTRGRATRGLASDGYTQELRGVDITQGNFQLSSNNAVNEIGQNSERGGLFNGAQVRGQIAQRRPAIYARQKYLDYDEPALAINKSDVLKEIVDNSVLSYQDNLPQIARRGMGIPQRNFQLNSGNAVNEIDQNSERGGLFNGAQVRGQIAQRRPANYARQKYLEPYYEEPTPPMEKSARIPKEIVEDSVSSYKGNSRQYTRREMGILRTNYGDLDEAVQTMKKSDIPKEIVEDSVPPYQGNLRQYARRGMGIPRGNYSDRDEAAQMTEKIRIMKENFENSVPSDQGNLAPVARRSMGIPRGNYQPSSNNAVNQSGQNSERDGSVNGAQEPGEFAQRRFANYGRPKFVDHDEPAPAMKKSDVLKEIVDNSVPSYQGKLQPKHAMHISGNYDSSGQVSNDHGEQKTQDLSALAAGLFSQLTLCSSDNKREIAAVSTLFRQGIIALDELIQKMCR